VGLEQRELRLHGYQTHQVIVENGLVSAPFISLTVWGYFTNTPGVELGGIEPPSIRR
jgi:hypothetical protein